MTEKEQKAFDQMREAVEKLQKRLVIKCQEQLVTFSFVDVDLLNAAAEALAAANAVSVEPLKVTDLGRYALEPQCIISRDTDADHGVKLSVYGDHIHPSAAGRARVIDAYLALKNDSPT